MNRLLAFFFSALLASGQVSPVLTRSANNQRHGVYQETTLTPANVGGLKLLFSIPIPGDPRLEAQPLVLPAIDGHDLLVLTTMANDVLGCDFHTGKILWRTDLGRPIDGSNKIDYWNINPHWGVLSTGVIDPDTQTLYVIAWSSPDGTAARGAHSLHAVNLHTGRETQNPLSINPLTYNPGHGLPVVRYAGQMRKQRSALLLETVADHKVIFFASGSVLETAQGASGWVAAADLETWRFTASWAATSRYYGAGIWMAGQGLSADSHGDLYALTGNGGFTGDTDLSESFVKLHYTPPTDAVHGMGQLQAVDHWTGWSDAGRLGLSPVLPTPQAMRLTGHSATTASGKLEGPVNHGHAMIMDPNQVKAYNDQDLGSGSVVVYEKYNLIGGAGKDGIWYSVNLTHMGNTMPADLLQPAANYAKLLAPPVWFTFAAFKHDAQGKVIGYENAAPDQSTDLDFNYDNLTHHMHSTPVLFESGTYGTMLFCWGENGNLRAWTLNPDGSLTFLANGAEVASANSPRDRGGMPGAMLAMSANGTINGVLWALVPWGDANREITGGYLAAYDATNFGRYSDGAGAIKLLWKSSTVFNHPKFNLPVITGGRVLVPTYSGTLDVYGL